MLLWKTQLLDFLPVYTENQFAPASAYLGIPLVQNRGKSTLLTFQVHRAITICSKTRLDLELDKKKLFLLKSATLGTLFRIVFRLKKYGPQKCPSYLKMPWLCNVNLLFEDQIKKTITKCSLLPTLGWRLGTWNVLPSIQKDCVPTTQKSLVIYEFSCRRDAKYVGRCSKAKRWTPWAEPNNCQFSVLLFSLLQRNREMNAGTRAIIVS